MTPQERAAALLERMGLCGHPAASQFVGDIIEHDQQTRRAALLECRDEINKLIGKDSGNWNRAIVYAADVANKLAQEGA
jgi:hypothetical protein